MEKSYLITLIVCLCLIAAAAGVGFYLYYQTTANSSINIPNSLINSNSNLPTNSLPTEKIGQQNLPLILKLDNQDFLKIWAIQKTNLGAKPTLHNLLNEITPVSQSKISEPTQLLGLIVISRQTNDQGDYYKFELLYRSQTRKWASGDPVLYDVVYNYDILECADDKANLDPACTNGETKTADVLNQTIIISERLSPTSQMGLSSISLIQPRDIKLEIPDILKKINNINFITIRFTSKPDQGSYWFIPAVVGKIKDDPLAVLERAK